MSIRAAESKDIGSIIKLVSSLSGYYLKDKVGDLPEWFSKTLEKNEFVGRISGDTYLNFVYEIDGEIVGYISIKEKSHLFHLFVLSQFQGRGISRKLWEHVRHQCGAPKYTLRSSAYAVPIYRKFGFVESDLLQEKDGILYQPMALVVG